MLTKLIYFGPDHFPPIQDSETLHGPSFGQDKLVAEKKNHISSLMTQEHPFSFLKGRNGGTKEARKNIKFPYQGIRNVTGACNDYGTQFNFGYD